MPRISFIFLVFLIIGCSSTSKLVRPEIKKEIPIKELYARGIAPINEKYKANYYRIVSYLFWNADGDFIEILGDFYHVKYGPDSSIFIAADFFRNYGNYRNTISVLIAESESSRVPIKTFPITVTSRKHGVFEEVAPRSSVNSSSAQQRVLFIKKLDLTDKYDVINKIKDDYITVTIGDKAYEFINPEVEFD